MAKDPQPEPISSTRWPGRISALRMICLSHELDPAFVQGGRRNVGNTALPDLGQLCLL